MGQWPAEAMQILSWQVMDVPPHGHHGPGLYVIMPLEQQRHLCVAHEL